MARDNLSDADRKEFQEFKRELENFQAEMRTFFRKYDRIFIDMLKKTLGRQIARFHQRKTPNLGRNQVLLLTRLHQ